MKRIGITSELHDWLTVRRKSHETFDSLLRKKLGLAARPVSRGSAVYPIAALAVGQGITLPYSRGLIDALRRARSIVGRKYRRYNYLKWVTILRDE